nr:unnamed protein product [Callosobruchus chinensis]
MDSDIKDQLEISWLISLVLTYSEPESTHHPTFKRYGASLEYCSHIWGAAAPTTLSILDAFQRRAIRLIGDPALTCHLQPLSHRRRRAVGDLSLFYRYSNGFCSFELTSIIPPLSKPTRCTRSSSHCKAVVLHTSRTQRYDRTFVPSYKKRRDFANKIIELINVHTKSKNVSC